MFVVVVLFDVQTGLVCVSIGFSLLRLLPPSRTVSFRVFRVRDGFHDDEFVSIFLIHTLTVQVHMSIMGRVANITLCEFLFVRLFGMRMDEKKPRKKERKKEEE